MTKALDEIKLCGECEFYYQREAIPLLPGQAKWTQQYKFWPCGAHREDSRLGDARAKCLGAEWTRRPDHVPAPR